MKTLIVIALVAFATTANDEWELIPGTEDMGDMITPETTIMAEV